MPASIQATFGFATGPAKNDLNELERHSRTVAEKIEGFFRRDPSKRAESAISQFTKTLAGGDVSGAIEGLSNRMNLFGLGVGVAVGVGITLFKKFSDQIIESKAAYGDLEAELNKPVAGLGVEATGAQIQKINASLDQFIQKRSSFIQRLKEAVSEGGVIGGVVSFATGGREGGQAETAIELNKAFQQQGVLRKQIADTEAETVAIREKELKVSTEQAQLDKISVSEKEKEAQIIAETADRKEHLEKILRDDEENRKTGLKLGLSDDVRRQYEEEIEKIGDVDEARKSSAQLAANLEKERVQNAAAIIAAITNMRLREAQASSRGQSPGEGTRANAIDQLHNIDQQLRQPLSAEQRAALNADREAVRAKILDQAQQGTARPLDLFQDLTGGIAQRQNRRNLERQLKNQLDIDAGLPQVKRDFKSESQEDIEAYKQGANEREERMKHGGFTEQEARDFLSGAPAGPAAPAPRSDQQPQQDNQPKTELGKILSDVASAVSKSIYDSMTRFWAGQ